MTKSRKARSTKQTRRPLAKSTGKSSRTTKSRTTKKQERSGAPAAATAAPASDGGAPAPAARGSKKATVIELLARPEGAAISELIAATGWQAHSVRAVLTGFRKDGKDVVRTKDEGGITHYRFAAHA